MHTINIPPQLQRFTGGQQHLKVQRQGAHCLRHVFESIEESYPGIQPRILDQEGNLRRSVMVYVDHEDARVIAARKLCGHPTKRPPEPLNIMLSGYEDITILPQ